jgi:hypothetical protein
MCEFWPAFVNSALIQSNKKKKSVYRATFRPFIRGLRGRGEADRVQQHWFGGQS